uniref:Cell cycle checkpoint protein RAD17 n=1 Tax=Panagrolaimus superbus TaxID=310955 RepID=A0A914Z4Q6_9BILA
MPGRSSKDDPFAHFSQIREAFRSNKSSSQLSTGSGKIPLKAGKKVPNSASDSKLSVATKRPIGQQQEPGKVKWYVSSFNDDIEILGEHKPPPKKRGKVDPRKAKKKKDDVVVVDENMPLANDIVGANASIFEPKSVEDLAVNSKRIEDVKEWIRGMMKPPDKRSKILLLTGPCGCGKTTTLKLLCNDLGVDFLEFDLPQEGEYNDFSEFDYYTESKPLEVFEKYIKSCEFTSTEPGASKHRLLCIENLPNIFYREPAKLKESLLRCASATRCMIVVVMSTSEKGWEFSPARLFPPTVLTELKIAEIKFNSIAPTFMTKAVNKMIDMMNIKTTSSMVKQIVEQADGDIRCAINNIQFSTISKAYKGGLSTAFNQIPMFHFIGKVMYAKRLEASTQESRATESKLSVKKWRRVFPPKEDLNHLVDNCVLSGEKLTEWIFEHEPNFAPSITACSRVLRDISEFDSFQSNLDWDHTSMFNRYCTEISVRTTIFNNAQCADGQAKTSRVRQQYAFKKPQLAETNRTRLEAKNNLAKLLPGLRTADLFTTTVSLLPRTNFFMRPEERKIINALSLRDKIGSSWGGLRIKVNPRPVSSKTLGNKVGKDSPRTTPYIADTIKEKEEEFDIFESDDDSF